MIQQPAWPEHSTDLRILDLSWGIAALGVLLLAEQGADVIKVEPPGRRPVPRLLGLHGVEPVAPVGHRRPQVRRRTRRVPRGWPRPPTCVVETFTPGVMDRLGIGFDALRAANPRLVTARSPRTPTGTAAAPARATTRSSQATSGQQWEQPGWRLGPIFLPMPMPSSGMICSCRAGILAALHAREETGRGQHVQTSLLQGALLYTTQIWQDVEHGDAAFHGLMAKTLPAGHPPADDLRVRRRLGAPQRDERPHAEASDRRACSGSSDPARARPRA